MSKTKGQTKDEIKTYGMKFYVRNGSLCDELEFAKKMQDGGRTSYRYMENALFSVEGEKVEIRISNDEIDFTTRMMLPAPADGDATFLIDAERCLKTIKPNNDEDTLTVELDTTEEKAKFRRGMGTSKGVSSLRYFNNIEDFGHFPTLSDDRISFKMTEQDLRRCLTLTVPAAESKAAASQFAGVHVIVMPDKMRFIGTTTFRTVMYDRLDLKMGVERTFTLPLRLAQSLINILPANSETDVTINVDDQYFEVIWTRKHLVAKLFNTSVPDLSGVSDVEPENEMICNRFELEGAIRRAMPAVSSLRDLPTLDIKFAHNKLCIDAINEIVDEESKQEIECNFTYDPFQISINGKDLEMMVERVPSEDIIIWCTSNVMYLRPSAMEDNEAEAMSMVIGLNASKSDISDRYQDRDEEIEETDDEDEA